jgi:hypothetical protein
VAPSGSTALCVTGMHRSGTSFAARVLELMGVSFGDESQLMGPGPDNPTGYWENRYVKELDDELLAHLGGAWDQPPVLADGWEHDPSLSEFRSRASSILDQAFGSRDATNGWIAWKDPRLSLLLPFWRTVAPITTTVVLTRNPHDVAASLRRRHNAPASHGALLWLRYVWAATANDPGHLLLRHQDFFDDLRTTMDRIASHLNLDAPDDDVVRIAEAHLDPGLRHDSGGDTPLDTDPLTELAQLVWNDGDVRLDLVPPVVMSAVANGWLRSPADTEELDRARAKVVELTERLRKRARARKAASGGPS